ARAPPARRGKRSIRSLYRPFVAVGAARHCKRRCRSAGATVGARSSVNGLSPRSMKHNLDVHDAAAVQRTALECEAIAADLERLKMMIADASDRLLASFNVVGLLA